MPDLEEQRQDLEVQIVREITGCLPESWNEALVEVKFIERPDGTQDNQFVFKGAPSRSELATPSPELMEAVRSLELLLKEHGEPCERLVYTLVRTPGSPWDFFGESFTKK